LSVAVGEIGLTFDYFYSLTLAEYYIILEGYRQKQLEELKNLRWQTWEIVRHNPFLKTPPKSPDKLIKFADEIEIDETRIKQAANTLKKAIEEHGNSRAKG
jgi:hypothetical protein